MVQTFSRKPRRHYRGKWWHVSYFTTKAEADKLFRSLRRWYAGRVRRRRVRAGPMWEVWYRTGGWLKL